VLLDSGATKERRPWREGKAASGGKEMAKKAAATVLVKLLSSAGTGYFYVAKKNPRKLPGKLEFMKYDPRVRRHVLFSEVKLR
jgi:large subunit ribosomal protein L33